MDPEHPCGKISFDIMTVTAEFLEEREDVLNLARVVGYKVLKYLPLETWHFDFFVKHGSYESLKFLVRKALNDPGFRLTIETKNYDIGESVSFSSPLGMLKTLKGSHDKKIDLWCFVLGNATRANQLNLVKQIFYKTQKHFKKMLVAHGLISPSDCLQMSPEWGFLIRIAAEIGNKDMVDFYISNGIINWEYGMSGALCSSDTNLISFFQAKLDNIEYKVKAEHIWIYNSSYATFKDIIHLENYVKKMELFSDYFIPCKSCYYMDVCVDVAGMEGNLELIDYLISRGASLYLALNGAAVSHRNKLVKSLIERHSAEIKSYDRVINILMTAAALTNNRDLVDFCISEGANDWDRSARSASAGGHIFLLKFFSRKAPLVEARCIASAVAGGQISVVEHFIDKKSRISFINYYVVLAVENCRYDLINLFISKGADDWNSCLVAAAETGNIVLINFFLSKGADKIDLAIAKASLNGYDLAKHFHPHVSNELNFLMIRAALRGQTDLVKKYVSDGADWWDGGMRFAAMGGHHELVNYFIAKGAENWYEGLAGAVDGSSPEHNNDEMINFFISKGAFDYSQIMMQKAFCAENNYIVRKLMYLPGRVFSLQM